MSKTVIDSKASAASPGEVPPTDNRVVRHLRIYLVRIKQYFDSKHLKGMAEIKRDIVEIYEKMVMTCPEADLCRNCEKLKDECDELHKRVGRYSKQIETQELKIAELDKRYLDDKGKFDTIIERIEKLRDRVEESTDSVKFDVITGKIDKLGDKLDRETERMMNTEACKNCEKLMATNRVIQDQAITYLGEIKEQNVWSDLIKQQYGENREVMSGTTEKIDKIGKQIEKIGYQINRQSKPIQRDRVPDEQVLVMETEPGQMKTYCEVLRDSLKTENIEKPKDLIIGRANKVILKMNKREDLNAVYNTLNRNENIKRLASLRLTKILRYKLLLTGLPSDLSQEEIKLELFKNDGVTPENLEILKEFTGRTGTRHLTLLPVET